MAVSQPSAEERALRLKLTDHVSTARHALRPPQQDAAGNPLDTPRDPNYRIARRELTAVTGELEGLQSRVFGRLSRLDGNNLSQAQTEWNNWKVQFLLDFDEEHNMLESNDPTVLDPSRAEKEAAENRATQAVQQVKNFINNLRNSLDELSGREDGQDGQDYTMPKHVYLTYQAKIEEAKQLIRPGLPEVFEAVLKLDPANSNTISTTLSQALLECDRELLTFTNKLQHLDLHESTFAPDPGAESTPANRSVVAHQAVSSLVMGASYNSTGGRVNYKQLMDSAPNFDGCPAQYPHWKREMVQDILPGQSDSRGLRLICAKCPHKNLAAMFDTVEEALSYLDDKYADEQKISDNYTMAFLDRTSVPGSNDQEKLMGLYEIVRQLYNTLKAVNRTEELTKQSQMVSRIVRLLPLQYKEQFETHKENKIATNYVATGRMPTQDQYDLLMLWLQSKTKTLGRCGVEAPSGASAKPTDTTPSTRVTNTKNNKSEGGAKQQQKRVSAVNISAVTTSGSVSSYVDINAPSKGKGAPSGPNDREKERIAAKWKEWGKCPVCKADGHLFNGKTGWSASNSLGNCARWRALPSVDERVDVLLKGKFCTLCTSWRHQTKDCPKAKNQDGSRNTSWTCYVKDAAGTPCGQLHSVHCHGTSRKISSIRVSATTFTAPPGIEDKDITDMQSQDVMLPIINLEVAPGVHTACLLDTGANCSVIATSLAEELGLKGKKLWQEITVVNEGTRLQELTFYVLNLKLHQGERKLLLIGLDTITTTPGAFSVQPAYELFPHIAPGALDKPSTPVRLLIGNDNADLVGSGGDGPNLVGNLKVFTIPFGPGFVLFGSHPSIKFTNPVPSKAVSFITRASRSPTMPRPPACDSWTEKDYLEAFRSFIEGDMMSYSLPFRCETCTNCKTCTMQEEGMTVKEFLELKEMEKNIWLDTERKQIVIKYPVCGDITKFRDNRYQAIKRAEALERSLEKKGMRDAYDNEFQDYEDRRVLGKTTEQEIQKWKDDGGFVHYVCHHPIEKPDSLSTKIRIVVDSTVKNCFTGPDLNSLWMKGPNQINSLFNVLLRWRTLLEVAVADLAKAYHSMETGVPNRSSEFYMRLVVWRKKFEKEWTTWGHLVCGMGDKPSSVFLELTKRIAAGLAKNIDPVLASLLLALSYVDDILLGGSEEDVQRIRGSVKELEDGKLEFDGTLVQVMALVGMKIKNICRSGETDERILAKQGRVLGLDWMPTEDYLRFKLTANVSPRKGQGRVEPDLTENDLDKVDSVIFTKRIASSISSYNFDPLGLISCFLVKFKIALREISQREHTWDSLLEDDLQKKWRDLLREMLSSGELLFPRSIDHPDTKGRPELIIYSDGSTLAFGSVAYFRWNMIYPGSYHTALVTSCAKVTPKSGMTPPRSELQGLVTAVRIATKILNHSAIKPGRVTIVTDSQCSVAACDMNANSLAVFFSNRVVEIITTMDSWGHYNKDITALDELSQDNLYQLEDHDVLVDLIQHTPGEQNPADWPTRGNISWSDLGLGSTWQQGPSYLHRPRSEWPLSRDFVSEVPAEEKKKKFVVSALESSTPEGNIFKGVHLIMESSNSLKKCLHNMARAIRAIRAIQEAVKKVKGKDPDLEPRDLEQAEWYFQVASQRDLDEDLQKKGSFDSLAIFRRDRVARMRGRLAPEAMMRSIGQDSLIVLSRRSRLAELVMIAAHEEDHRQSPGDTLFRSRSKFGYWVIRGRTLAEKVVRNCLKCKLDNPVLLQQKMADLPLEITEVPVKSFSHVCIDYAGAVPIKTKTTRRTVTTKAWPVIIVCEVTGALHVELAENYSTSGFITCWTRFTAVRGAVLSVRTDMGSQLVSAGKQVTDEVGDLPNFDWKEIKSATASQGTVWKHAHTQSQWQNGRAESCVRALKKTMRHLYKGNDLSFGEFQALLSLCADRINDRPLGVRHHGGAEGDLCVVTPNLLIQGGRGCAHVAHDSNFRSHMGQIHLKLSIIEAAFVDWWNKWFDVVWESLVPIQKWRHKHRNVEVGDIVLLKYEAALGRPQWRRGRVTEVHPDRHGVVRDVTILTRSRHKKEKLNSFRKKKMTEQRVSIQRLAIILTAEEVAKLPQADPNLHFCTEEARFPDASQWSRSPSPSLVPTCPTPPQLVPHSDLAPPGVSVQDSAAAPEKDDEVPGAVEKPDVPAEATSAAQHQLQIHTLAINSLSCTPTYLCWECDTRDRLYYVSGE